VDAGVAAVHCHERAVHGHVHMERIPQECQARYHQWLSNAPSAINNFASLGNHLGEIKCRNWNEANSSKETVKMGLFGHNSILELNTKVWLTLPAFYPLLTRFYPPNGLEVTEFRRSTSLLISVSGQNSG
jgi:hypothetical protein